MNQEKRLDKNIKKIFLIDSHSIIFRSYHAISPLMSNGRLVNATYGFFTILFNILDKFSPDYIACAFDVSDKELFRKKEYPLYKANRQIPPEDLKIQFGYVKDILKAFDIRAFEFPGFEADDIIASLVNKFKNEGINIFIVTGDRDLLQLVDSNVSVILPGKSFSSSIEINIDNVKDFLGFSNDYLIDYKGLRGDPSDNIPGISGIGDKSAKDLILKFGSIEDIYINISKIKPALVKKLVNGRDLAFTSKKLSTLFSNIEFPSFLLNDLRINFDKDKVIEKLSEYQFKSLVNKFFPELSNNMLTQNSITEGDFDKNLIDTVDKLSILVERIKSIEEFSFDTETDGLDIMKSICVGISIAINEKETFYILLTDNDILKSNAFQGLVNIFSNENIKKIGHNLKFDLHSLINIGVSVRGLYFDTQIASRLLNFPSTSLKTLVSEIFNFRMLSYEELTNNFKKTIYELDVKSLSDYSCSDAHFTYLLYKYFSHKFGQDLSQKKVFYDIDIPLIQILFEMERKGIMINFNMLNSLYQDFSEKINEISKKIFDIAGEEFNISSTNQLGEILFTKLKIPPPVKKNKNGFFSTNEYALKNLEADYPIVGLVLQFKELSKLRSTYTKSLAELVFDDHRLHTTYNITGTTTGRLSSVNPNLQNIPVKSDYGKYIRSAFIADVGNMLFSFDYSQIELRIMAHFSKDVNLKKAFEEKIDVHSYTASLIFNKKYKDVSSKDRRIAKVINFGIIYGISSFGLSQQLGISRSEASKFIEDYFNYFPGIKSYYKDIEISVDKNSYVETLFGRRRYFEKSGGYGYVSRMMREAINMPVQGTNADIIKIAMGRISRFLKNYSNVSMILQIHDELIFEFENFKDKFQYTDIIEGIKNAMVNNFPLNIPLEVEVKYGNDWANLITFS